MFSDLFMTKYTFAMFFIYSEMCNMCTETVFQIHIRDGFLESMSKSACWFLYVVIL